jgi:rubrerythrin
MSRENISSRLEKLEDSARSGPSGRCPECGLRPQDNGYIVVDDNDPAGHIPEVCPECGRSTKIHIRVVYEGEEGEGRKL